MPLNRTSCPINPGIEVKLQISKLNLHLDMNLLFARAAKAINSYIKSLSLEEKISIRKGINTPQEADI